MVFPEKLLDELPKALPALLIPLLQLAWKHYTAGRTNDRKTHLRQTIGDLSNQRKALEGVANLPGGALALEDLDAEIATHLDELSGLRNAKAKAIPLSEKPAYVRWLLLYMPSGLTSWLIHSAYFLSFAFGFVVVFYSRKEFKDPSDALFFSALAFIPTVILRNTAAWVDQGKAWLGALLFWYSTLIIIGPLFLMIVFDKHHLKALLDTSWNDFYAVIEFSVVGFCAFKASNIRTKYSISLKLTDRFLMFRPCQRLGWLPIASFYLTLPVVARSVWVAVEEDMPLYWRSTWISFVLMFYFGNLVCSWRWAQSLRPRQRNIGSHEVGRP